MLLLDRVIQEFSRLPDPGTPAHKLTDRDKLALAIAAGVPTHFEFEGTTCRLVSDVPFAISDRGDDGYFIMQGPKPTKGKP